MYGASHPRDLAERAAEAEMDALALTDRDGVYGAVRFAKACMAVGIRPILGVDLAIEPTGLTTRSEELGVSGRRTWRLGPKNLASRAEELGVSAPRTRPLDRTPARGGRYADTERALPRITLLAGS